MNCKNCGMPLVGTKCEYCGTDYSMELSSFFHEEKKPEVTRHSRLIDRDAVMKALEKFTCDYCSYYNSKADSCYYTLSSCQSHSCNRFKKVKVY